MRNITRFGRLAVSVGSSSWRAAPMCPEWGKLLGICIGNTRWMMCSYTTCMKQFAYNLVSDSKASKGLESELAVTCTTSLWFSFPELEPLTMSFQADKFPRSGFYMFSQFFWGGLTLLPGARFRLPPLQVLSLAEPALQNLGARLSTVPSSVFLMSNSACHVHWTAMMRMNDTAKHGKGWLDWSFHCTWWRQGGSTLPVTWSMRGILRRFASSNLWEDSSSAGWIHFWVVSGRAKFMPYSQCQRTCGCISEARDWCSMLFGRASNCSLVARSWR